ncbi:MAG TPA: glycosyltransferase family 4 protein [Novosphingobium sp.]
MEHLLPGSERRTEDLDETIVAFEPFKALPPPRYLRPLRVALVGNFAPRKCGIATFTTDIFEQLSAFHSEVSLDVYALQDSADPLEHERVYMEIVRESREDYARAARQMNQDGVDAVWIQHEFGIFGGENGDHVLDLVERVAAPVVVTMHTVLSQPSPEQDEIMRFLVSRASRLMVMCEAGRELLVRRYRANPDRVDIIEHGAPDRPLCLSPGETGARRRLMTFGLLGPGKGLETVIEALPAIVLRHPDTVYRIVGASHPKELQEHGEKYRRELEALAERLGVASHIEWINRFLETEELVTMLEECDIYITPYPNLQQSTSGTLSYAVAMGRAVISTPYIHARELLDDTGGILVEPNDAAAIADAVNHLLENPHELQALQLRTYRRGRRTVWRYFAANSRTFLDAAVVDEDSGIQVAERAAPGLAAFNALCDGTGILQHGKYAVPDRNHGYCLDDNVRALMLVHRIAWRNPGEELERAAPFASFIQHAWNAEARRWRNFMNYDRTWCEDIGSQDSNGRTIWALGDCAANSRLPQLQRWAAQAFDDHAEIALHFDAPRSIAFAALGAAALLRARSGQGLATAIIDHCGDMLYRLIARARRPDWTWFETMVGYDNPRLSQALMECGKLADRDEWIEAGLDSLRWIMMRQCAPAGHFRPIGSESFGRMEEILAFDQQPLEAWAAIDACASAWRCGDDTELWLEHARRAYRWFLGENDRGAVLADLQFGSCLDGVTPLGANENIGAESLLAFQLAYYSYDQLMVCAGPPRRENAATSSRTQV